MAIKGSTLPTRKDDLDLGTFVREIVDLLKDAKRSFWAGKLAPRFDFTVSDTIYDPAADFREPAVHHQAFDVVFMVERDLGCMKQWPLILDEALRLIAPGGAIVIRFRQGKLLSIFELANFIEKWTKSQFELICQIQADLDITFAFRLLNKHPRPAKVDTFSFGLITDGRKPDAVRIFVESVLAVEEIRKTGFEIMVCGPDSVITDLGELAAQVRLVPQPTAFVEQGWITRKKNLIVSESKFENIVLVHDRYTLHPSFLKTMRTFGGDFDVIIPRQETKDGRRIPDWVMVADHLNWSTPGWMEYGDYHPNVYINGGVTIAKKGLLAKTRWSELLLWGQAEDVDLTRRLQDVGVTPRLARRVTLLTDKMRTGFIEGFERLPWIQSAYMKTHRPNRLKDDRVLTVTPYHLGHEVDFRGEAAISRALDSGIVLPRYWQRGEDGLAWCANEDAELSLIILDNSTNLVLEIHGRSGLSDKIKEVWMNACLLKIEHCNNNRLTIHIEKSFLPESKILHFRLRGIGEERLEISGMKLSRSHHYANYKLREPLYINTDTAAEYLLEGWHQAEMWGVWSARQIANLRLHIGDDIGDDVSLTIALRAFTPAGHGRLICGISINGVAMDTQIFAPGDGEREIILNIPNEIMTDEMEIGFQTSRLRSPTDTGAGVDGRMLGIGLVKIILA